MAIFNPKKPIPDTSKAGDGRENHELARSVQRSVPAFSANTPGLVPAPVTPAGNFLRDDGIWAAGGGGGGAPTGATYVTITNDATLTAERTLAAGAGLSLVDGGANNPVTLDRAALTGDVTASAGSNATTIAAGAVTTAKMGGDVTAAGKALLDDASAADQRTTLGLATVASSASASDLTSGTLANARLDAELQALAGLVSAADQLPYFTGVGTAALTTLTTFIRTLLDDVDAATARATLGTDASGASRPPNGSAGGDMTGTYPNPTIANDAVTFAKMANLATDKLVGRSTAGTGDPEAITCTSSAREILALSSPDKGYMLLYNGGWQHLPPGTAGQVLAIDGDSGVPTWTTL